MLSLVTDSNPGIAHWFPIVPTGTILMLQVPTPTRLRRILPAAVGHTGTCIRS
jgi:phage tail protein X